MPVKWPELIASACVGLYKTPREVLQMTVAEIELLSAYQPDVKAKKSADGAEQAALQEYLAWMQLTPKEKLEKRLRERES
jgi:hypothetical protein